MAEHLATICWRRAGRPFTNDDYSRAHVWRFDGGLEIPASASPHIVPAPNSIAQNLDPEEAFVAALASCHMLFFLSLAAAEGIVVDGYVDNAIGYLGKDPQGRTSMMRVVLRPEASYYGELSPSQKDVEILHRRSHDLCFIANSVTTDVVTEIVT